MILTNYSLLPHNTFGFNIHCDCFFEYTTPQELKDFIATGALTKQKYLHIGAGSNLVFMGDFRGTILHSAIQGIEILEQTPREVVLRVGASQVWDDFVLWTLTHDFYGLENLSHIPGEVGAAAVQNIGAYGKEVAQYIKTIEAINLETGATHTFNVEACDYAYRHSIFKTSLKGKYAITHVCFALTRTFEPDIKYGAIHEALRQRNIVTPSALDLRQCIIDIRDSKLPNPKDVGNAGSFFMNPVIDAQLLEQLQRTYPAMPHYAAEEGFKIPAGWLIEQCGWKGKSIGDAGVYAKQALVLVNHGGASGADIAHLAQTIVSDVYNKFGIRLTPEANFID
jgi:UDP-N-acetylmuramate dehydrogenase